MSIELETEVWDAVCGRLRQAIGEGPFVRWLRDLSPCSGEGSGESVVIAARSELAAQVVRRRYVQEIERCFREVAARDVRVEVRAVEGGEEASEIRETGPRPRIETGSPDPGAGAVAEQRLGDPSGERKLDSDDPREPRLEEIVIGAANRMACCAVIDVLEQPGKVYNPLYIHGSTGTGKTHFLRALYAAFRHPERYARGARRGARDGAARRGAGTTGANAWRIDWPRELRIPQGLSVRYVTADRFFHHYVASVQDGTMRKFHDVYRKADVLLIDDFHLLTTKKKTIEEFLQTFNALADAGKQVVITSSLSPRELRGLNSSLVGRLLSGLVVKLGRPGYDMRLEILRSRVARLSVDFTDEVLEFLAENVRGSVRELLGALNQLEVHARIDRDGVGLDLARSVLAERVREQSRKIRLQTVHEAVAAHYGVAPDLITGRSRQALVVRARQVAMHLGRALTRESFASIGGYFGGRSHSTVQAAVRQVEALARRNDNSVPWDLEILRERLEEAG